MFTNESHRIIFRITLRLKDSNCNWKWIKVRIGPSRIVFSHNACTLPVRLNHVSFSKRDRRLIFALFLPYTVNGVSQFEVETPISLFSFSWLNLSPFYTNSFVKSNTFASRIMALLVLWVHNTLQFFVFYHGNNRNYLYRKMRKKGDFLDIKLVIFFSLTCPGYSIPCNVP